MQWSVQLNAGPLIDLPQSLIDVANQDQMKNASSFFYGETADFGDESPDIMAMPILLWSTSHEAVARTAEAFSWLFLGWQGRLQAGVLGNYTSLSFVNLRPLNYEPMCVFKSGSVGLDPLPEDDGRIPQAVPDVLDALLRFAMRIQGAVEFPKLDPAASCCDWVSLTVARMRTRVPST